MNPKAAITPDAVRQDLPHLLGFLKALEAGLPDSVPADLLGLLESAVSNPLSLTLLASAVARGHETLNQPPVRR